MIIIFYHTANRNSDSQFPKNLKTDIDLSSAAVHKNQIRELGKAAVLSIYISHLKVMGKHNEGTSQKLLKEIDDANARGTTVWADQYPYTASSAPLPSQIPPKYLVGGIPVLLERLKNPEIRQQILYSIFHEVDEFESAIYSAGFDGTLIVGASKTPEYVNKTIGQIAREEGKEPIDALCDVLLAHPASCAYGRSPPERRPLPACV